MDCVLNRPTCKRTIMEGKGLFKKETCPVMEKPKCMFASQQCPLLPEENGCTMTKVMDIIKKGGCFANQPPPPPRQGCCCCCAQLEPEPEPDNTVARCRIKRVVELPPCSKCKRGINAPEKEKPVPLSKSPSSKKKKKYTSPSKKRQNQNSDGINKFVPDCTLNSRRPFPCADCLMQLLDCPLRSVDYDNSKVYCKARAVKCPFTQVIDTCDTSCLCSNVPAIDTGPKCPFLPEPCPCVAALSCPLSRIPPNPLVERSIPPACQKPFCRCYCPLIPNPCSFSCPECPVHSGKIKCPLEQGNICPSMFAPVPQICYCTPADSSKRADSPVEHDEKVALKNNSKTTLDVTREVEVEKVGMESSNNQAKMSSDPTKKLTTKPGTQINYGKEQENSTVLLNENQNPIPSPKQEQYQKTIRFKKHPFDQYTESRSDQFPYFVDTKRGKLRSNIDTKSDHASVVEPSGALEEIEDYYDGQQDCGKPTTSELYSASSKSDNVRPCGCRCWSEYKKRRKLNYPSIRTESLYKSTETKNNSAKDMQSINVNRSRLAKMLPSPSTYVGMNMITKKDAPKLCKTPLGKVNFNCHEPPNKPTTSNISERDLEIAERFANRISSKIEGPEFKFFDEFVCDCMPQPMITRLNECPCDETATDQACACGVDNEFPQCGCPCGLNCPSKLSSPIVERTFHVPTCPLSCPLPQPKSPEKDDQVCPFSPNQCPLGPYCLFPVTAKYDPRSPKIPKTDAICFCQAQDCLRPPPTIETPCPLEKVNHKKCVCGCKPASCPPCCPLAQPESLPPIFRRCPFICPGNNNCTPPPITRLCNCCAQTEDCEKLLNEPPHTEMCCCENASPEQKKSLHSKTNPYFGQNGAQPNGKNKQTDLFGSRFINFQNKVPEVAFLPESLIKLLKEGENEDNFPLNDFNCLCTNGMNVENYEKANYESYKSGGKSSKCCPCAQASKPRIKCPLNLENCPCLNLTQTDACPLNALRCPIERPICPVKPIITPETKPVEATNVNVTTTKDTVVNPSANNANPVVEAETDLTKKSAKIEQTVDKKHVTSVEPKSVPPPNLAPGPSNAKQKSKVDSDNSKPVKSLSTKKQIVPSHRQKLLGGTPKCLLEKPKCPLTGIKPAVFSGVDKTSFNGSNKDNNEMGCPIMNPPCELFPQGRCPMMEVGACNCNYPVAPCMAPAQCGYVNAPPQYCYKEDCCMGLTLPPIYPAAHGKYDTGFYYKFMDWKPGEKTTKHYIEISEEPPPMDFFHGHETRQHDNWWILREGKGYEECKKVKEIIEKRGPVGHRGTQFDKKDNPLDIETQTIMENRKNREDKLNSVETAQPSWKD